MTISKEELARAREFAVVDTEFGMYSHSKRKMFNISGKTKEYDEHLYKFNSLFNGHFILRLLDSYEALRAEHERGLEVIRFYADKSAWEHSAEYFECDDFLKVLDNDEEKIEGDFYGGRRARAYLKSLEQKGGVDEAT